MLRWASASLKSGQNLRCSYTQDMEADEGLDQL